MNSREIMEGLLEGKTILNSNNEEIRLDTSGCLQVKSLNDEQIITKKGLYNKFIVRRTDGKSSPGEKHCGCYYFVLDLTHDKFAFAAIKAYAEACFEEYPELSVDL